MVRDLKGTASHNFLPVNKIIEDKDAIRKSQTDISGLKYTISDVGLLQPIIVRNTGEGYKVIDGARRLRALKELQVEELIIGREVIIDQDETDADAAFKQIIANIQREDINPVELGYAFVLLKEKYGYNYNEIADIIGKTAHYVTAKVGLAKRLIPEVKDMIVRDWELIKCIQNTLNDGNEKIYEPNINVIEDIARLPGELQKAAYEFIKENGLDKKDALKYLKSVKQDAETMKIAISDKSIATNGMDQSISEPVGDKDIQKYFKKIERDLDQLSTRIKTSEYVEKRNVIPELESLIEKLYALCSEFKAQDSGSVETPIKIQ